MRGQLLSCSSCQRELPPEAFSIRSGTPRGRQSQCRQCRSESRRRAYKKDPERHLADGRRRYREDPRFRERALERFRKRRYGVTPEEVAAISTRQGGVCAICSTLPDEQLHLDHDHRTGKVRGLLCRRCNVGIGYYEKFYMSFREEVDAYVGRSDGD